MEYTYRTEPHDIEVLAFIKTRYMGATAKLPPRVMAKVTRKHGDGHKAQYAGWDHRMSVEDNHMKAVHMACLELEMLEMSLAKRKAWVYGFYAGEGEGNYVLAEVKHDGYVLLNDSAGGVSASTFSDGTIPVYSDRADALADVDDTGMVNLFKIRRASH
jgi:hypothetical protein